MKKRLTYKWEVRNELQKILLFWMNKTDDFQNGSFISHLTTQDVGCLKLNYFRYFCFLVSYFYALDLGERTDKKLRCQQLNRLASREPNAHGKVESGTRQEEAMNLIKQEAEYPKVVD